MSFSKMAFAALKDAKKQFGEYSYHDKGADEVMDVGELVTELRKLPIEEVVSELLLLADMDDTHILLCSILGSIEDLDAVFENETLAALY